MKVWQLFQRRQSALQDPGLRNVELMLSLTHIIEGGLGFLSAWIESQCDHDVCKYLDKTIASVQDEITSIVEQINTGRYAPTSTLGKKMKAAAKTSFKTTSASSSKKPEQKVNDDDDDEDE